MAAVLDAGALGFQALGLLQALAALALVAALGLAARRVLAARRTRPSEHMEVEERLSLDLRHTLVIVRVEQRRFLLATAEQQPAALIAELSAAPPTGLARPSAAGASSHE